MSSHHGSISQTRIPENILERVLNENSGFPPTPGISKHISFSLDSNANPGVSVGPELGKDSFCFKNVVKSQINFQMLPYKLFYLFTDGAMACVGPYRSLYFKQMGLSPSRIGIISASKPFASFIANPLAGLLADRLDKRRLIMVISLLIWIILMVLLGFVPPPEESCQQILPTCSQKDSKVISKRSSPFLNSHIFSSLEGSNNKTFFLQYASKYEDSLSNSFKHRNNYRSRRNSPVPGRRLVSEDESLRKNESNIGRGTPGPGGLSNDTPSANECLTANQSWRYDQQSLDSTFITILIITCVTYCAFGPAMRLADTATLSTLSQSQAKDMTDYGWHRSFGGLGWAVCSLAVGALNSLLNSDQEFCGVTLNITDYRLSFLLFGAVATLAFICSFWMNFKVTSQQEWNTQWAELRKLFCNLHYLSVLCVAFFVGICNGSTWGFLLWHLQNLGASQFLIGLLEALQSSSELVIGFFCHTILQKFGHVNTLCVGLLMYAVRFGCYALIENPYWMVPVEIAHGISFLMTWTTLVSYLASAVSSDCLTTAQGVLGAFYFGLGNGIGSFSSGLLIDRFDAVTTFSAFAVACAVVLITFFFIQQVCPQSENLPVTKYSAKNRRRKMALSLNDTKRRFTSSDSESEPEETSVFLPSPPCENHVTIEDISKRQIDSESWSLTDSGVDSIQQRSERNGPYGPIPDIPGSPRVPGPKMWLYLPIIQSQSTDV